jgi:hypothetical protein
MGVIGAEWMQTAREVLCFAGGRSWSSGSMILLPWSYSVNGCNNVRYSLAVVVVMLSLLCDRNEKEEGYLESL